MARSVKSLVYLFTDEFAEEGPNFVPIVERQKVKCDGDRHRSFDFANMAADSGVLL